MENIQGSIQDIYMLVITEIFMHIIYIYIYIQLMIMISTKLVKFS
jgi:hypothetical protein